MIFVPTKTEKKNEYSLYNDDEHDDVEKSAGLVICIN